MSQNDWKLDLALKQWADDTEWSEEVNHRPNFCDYVPYDYEAEGGDEEEVENNQTEMDRLKNDMKVDKSRRRGWTVPTGVGLSMGRRSGMSIQDEDPSPQVSLDSRNGRPSLGGAAGGPSHPSPSSLARVVTPERYKGSDINESSSSPSSSENKAGEGGAVWSSTGTGTGSSGTETKGR